MKINTLISLTNTKLAGETLTYAQLRPLFDEVIIDINADLNACFPLFSTYAPDYNNLEAEYDCFPDMYLASVVATGAAYKFYTIDEEGIAVAQSFGADYQKALFHMVRDYSSSVPLVFQNTGKQGYITASNNGEWLYAASDPLSITRTNESGITIGINPDIRIQQGPQGATGAQGEKGDTGNYYRIEAQGSKIQAVLYDSTTGQPMDAPIILLGDLNDITRTSIHGELLDNLSVGVVNTTESTAKVTLTKSGDTYLLNFDVPKGIDGKTPQKGIDYFTDADISEIKTYADNKDADILETAKAYADTADSRTLTNAKTYVDEALTNKVDKLDGYGLATGTFYMEHGTAKTWKRISINRTDGIYPDSFIIPSYTSDLKNDSGYATETYVNNAVEEVVSGKADKTYVDEVFKEINDNIAIREKSENKGMPNGYAPLDSTGKLPNNYLHDAIPHTTASGYPITLTDHLAGEELLSCILYGADGGVGDLVSDGEYSGKYAVPIYIRGKNLIDVSAFSNIDNYFNAKKDRPGLEFFNVKFPAGTYTASINIISTPIGSITAAYIKDNTIYPVKNLVNTTDTQGEKSVSFTMPQDWYIRLYFAGNSNNSTRLSALMECIDNLQLEYGSSATEYEEYTEPSTTTIYLDVPLTTEQSAEVSGLKAIDSDVNTITTETSVTPSKIEVEYYQDINKVITNLTNAILAQGGNV